MIQINLQNRKRLIDLEKELMVPGEGVVRDFEKVLYTLLYIKRISIRTFCIAHGTLLHVIC